jgi:hypothetical protein
MRELGNAVARLTTSSTLCGQSLIGAEGRSAARAARCVEVGRRSALGFTRSVDKAVQKSWQSPPSAGPAPLEPNCHLAEHSITSAATRSKTYKSYRRFGCDRDRVRRSNPGLSPDRHIRRRAECLVPRGRRIADRQLDPWRSHSAGPPGAPSRCRHRICLRPNRRHQRITPRCCTHLEQSGGCSVRVPSS